MNFGVLGPLAVWTTAGQPVKVPEAKVRALLANLLIHQGRTVPAERLIDDLWGDGVPNNPGNALQAKVSQLRRALDSAEPGGRDLVVHQVPGYRLTVPPAAIDAGRFAALVAKARATSDPRQRCDLLAESLGLWRGDTLADFADDAFARGAIAGWDEQRQVAREEWAEAALAAGDHHGLAGELGELVARNPLRERLRASHMRALYRSGRQTEALDSYNEIRILLRDEMGLDPGPELDALHLAILEHDPALEAPPDVAGVRFTPHTEGPAAGSARPAMAVTRPRTNLPAALTDLVGRGPDVTELRGTLEGRRLVTLTGLGGVGKTRLALEAAWSAIDAFPDGVWLVELASLERSTAAGGATGADVVERIADAIGLRDDMTSRIPGASTGQFTERLTRALEGKQALLVIDNCEHVIEPVAELLEHLLAIAPGLHVLATSREGLGIGGEVLYAVAPLDVPDRTGPMTLAEARQASAVRLFELRAAAAATTFRLHDDDAPAVAAICRRLDGLPLALELAATRVRVLGVQELARRLDDRFDLLARPRGGPPRQQALRAMIDWSWELLTESERLVLQRLAVHAGGCGLEAAEEVCAGGGVRSGDVLDLVARLVDRSLVVATAGPDGPRYRLLESVAAYGIERLSEADDLVRVQERHGLYYTAFAEQADEELRGPAQAMWLSRLDTETENLRSALDGATRRGDAALALRLTNALAWYWLLRGRLSEGRRSLRAALAVEGDASTAERADAQVWLTALAMLSGDITHPHTQNEVVLEGFAAGDHPARRARAEWLLAFAEFGAGDLTACEKRVDRALATFDRLGDRWGTAAALSARAAHAIFRGDLQAVEQNAQESMALFRAIGDRWGQMQAADSLCTVAEIRGDYERCSQLHRDGLEIAHELGLWTEISHLLSRMGRIALLKGDLAEAEDLHQRALHQAAEHSDMPGEEFAEVGLGLVHRRQGRLDEAEAHLDRWLAWNRNLEASYGVALILAELGFIAELRGDAAGALELHHEGLDAARTTGDPRAIALALEGMAAAHLLAGQPDRAAQLLGAATAGRESVQAPLPAAERGDVDRVTAGVVAALGDAGWAEHSALGRSLTLDEVLPR